MFLHLDPQNGIPVYEQIVRQIKYAIAAGALPAGELTPSVRELARELAINPNTVAKAYRDLQSEGILTLLRGTGLAVTDQARRLCRDARQQLLSERIGQVVAEAVQSGLSAQDIERIFRDRMRSERASLEKRDDKRH